MKTEEQLLMMAVALRGLCSSKCKTMEFHNVQDTFNDMWNFLDEKVRREWVELASLLDILSQSDDFQKVKAN